MDDFTQAREQLNRYLHDTTATAPLRALQASSSVQADISARQREAVRAAARVHSWAEIGDALGVSKQAAHQKFAKQWAADLKSELEADAHQMKTAMKANSPAEAAAAKARLDAVIDEFKSGSGRGRR